MLRKDRKAVIGTWCHLELPVLTSQLLNSALHKPREALAWLLAWLWLGRAFRNSSFSPLAEQRASGIDPKSRSFRSGKPATSSCHWAITPFRSASRPCHFTARVLVLNLVVADANSEKTAKRTKSRCLQLVLHPHVTSIDECKCFAAEVQGMQC